MIPREDSLSPRKRLKLRHKNILSRFLLFIKLMCGYVCSIKHMQSNIRSAKEKQCQLQIHVEKNPRIDAVIATETHAFSVKATWYLENVKREFAIHTDQ